jgi:hypothetical protein
MSDRESDQNCRVACDKRCFDTALPPKKKVRHCPRPIVKDILVPRLPYSAFILILELAMQAHLLDGLLVIIEGTAVCSGQEVEFLEVLRGVLLWARIPVELKCLAKDFPSCDDPMKREGDLRGEMEEGDAFKPALGFTFQKAKNFQFPRRSSLWINPPTAVLGGRRIYDGSPRSVAFSANSSVVTGSCTLMASFVAFRGCWTLSLSMRLPVVCLKTL